MWCSGLPCISGQLEEEVGSVCHETDLVWWSSMDLWSIGGGSSAKRSAKFGVVVCKASLLEWESICHRSMLHHYTSPAN